MDKLKKLIWYEKYRPTSLRELIMSKDYKKVFRKSIRKAEIPHLLFHGPAGSGKTTLSMILINKCANRRLILNASSEDRGIGVIKTKIAQFAGNANIDQEKKHIVFFDEANGLTPEAQEALKNTMDKYSSNCRFIFTTNYIDKITEPIQSRCMVFGFESLETEDINRLATRILKAEGVSYTQEDINLLVERFEPDVRKIINNLQAGSINGKFKIKNILPIYQIEKIKKLILSGEITKIRKLWVGQTDFTWFFKSLFDSFLKNIKPKHQIPVGLTIAEYLYRDKLIADREINATACVFEICEHLQIKISYKN